MNKWDFVNKALGTPKLLFFKSYFLDFPGVPIVKNLPAKTGGSIRGQGRFHIPQSN